MPYAYTQITDDRSFHIVCNGAPELGGKLLGHGFSAFILLQIGTPRKWQGPPSKYKKIILRS